MADQTRSTTASTTTGTRAANPVDWRAGVAAGLAGAGVMAVLISLTSTPTLAVAIPSLYGLAPPPNGVAGWVVHLSHGAVFGVVFATAARFTPVDFGSLGRCVALGIAYGVGLWIVAAGLLMPVWLRVVGVPSPPPVPNFAPPSLLWHAVFGVVLGAGYPVTVRRL